MRNVAELNTLGKWTNGHRTIHNDQTPRENSRNLMRRKSNQGHAEEGDLPSTISPEGMTPRLHKLPLASYVEA